MEILDGNLLLCHFNFPPEREQTVNTLFDKCGQIEIRHGHLPPNSMKFQPNSSENCGLVFKMIVIKITNTVLSR